MGRYINKERLLRQLKEKEQDSCIEYNAVLGIMIAEGIVNELPIEDVALVVHAKWIHPINSDLKIWVCSNCGGEERNSFKREFGSYCSYCGAKMDEDYKEA